MSVDKITKMKPNTLPPEAEEKVRRLKAWSQRRPQGPYSLEIHPTYKCNLSCSFCKYHAARLKGDVALDQELPMERWLTLLNEAGSMGTKEVRICGGGEPLYEPSRAMTLIRRIKALSLKGSLLTNGTLLSREMARELVNSEWDLLEVSIDAPDEQTHDTLRGVPGTFRQASSTLKWIAEQKREQGKQLPRVRLYFVVVAQNYRLLPRMVSYAHEHGVSEIFLLSLCPGGIDEQHHALTDRQQEECLTIVKIAKENAERNGIEFCTGLLENTLEQIHPQKKAIQSKSDLKGENADGTLMDAPCFSPWTYLQIHFDGKVGPCCNTWVGEEAELKTKSLREVWLNSPHLNRIRNSLLKWEFGGRCADCGIQHLRDAEQLRQALLCSEGVQDG